MQSSGSLRVLLISHGLPPHDLGGVEQHVDGLARALLAAGHEVHVYAKTGRSDLPQGTRVDDPAHAYATTRVVYRYEHLASLRDLYRQPVLDAAFDAFLSERAFDVAHVHHLTGMSTGLVDVLRARGIPVVMTLHDYWSICPRGQMWRSDGVACATVEPSRCATCLTPTFGGWLPDGRGAEVVAEMHADAVATLSQVDRLVVPSERGLPPFLALGLDRERFSVVENGVDTVRLAHVPAVRPGRPLRVGYLGTVIPSKGLDVLVDAVRQLPIGSTTLAVHGNVVPYHGDATFATRVLQRLTAADRVTLHGPYGLDDLPRLLSQIDVLAAPALWHETFGLTVREALAAGRPVVVSRVGGLQDAVADGQQGFVVEPGDAGALAAALGALLIDPGRLARMGEAARRGARGFAEMAAEMIGVYRAVVSTRRPRDS